MGGDHRAVIMAAFQDRLNEFAALAQQGLDRSPATG
jgi:hypothetical protein